MRLSEAIARIQSAELAAVGYRVAFEWTRPGGYEADSFPEQDETPFMSEADAWHEARRFSSACNGTVVNVYVIHAGSRKPVDGYKERTLSPRKGK